MSKTGTYKWDAELGKVVKISDEIPKSCSNAFDVSFPRGGYKYFDKQCQRTFHSKQEKREYLKSNGMKQVEGVKNKREMVDRNCQIVNDMRNKKGLKSKTESALIGDAK